MVLLIMSKFIQRFLVKLLGKLWKMVGGGHILRTNHNDEAIIAITEQIRKIREENARRHSRDYSHVFR